MGVRPNQTVNQGLPNTPENAWPVKVTDGGSIILGSPGNPFPVSGNVNVGNGTVDVGNLPLHKEEVFGNESSTGTSSVITNNSRQSTGLTFDGTPVSLPIEIPPGPASGVSIFFDTSAFARVHVWVKKLQTIELTVVILSEITVDSFNLDTQETSFVIPAINLQANVTPVEARGTITHVRLINSSIVDPVQVIVAAKGIG